MTRNAICYVTNLTKYGYNPQSVTLMHGRAHTPPQSIDPDETNKLLFSFYKTPNAAHGSTAYIEYLLNDGSTLYIAVNCPYEEDGNSGDSNCFFYAGIQNVNPSKGSLYRLDYEVKVGGNHMDPVNPTKGNDVTAWLTIRND